MCFPRTELCHVVRNLIFFGFSVVSVLRLWFVRLMTTCEVLCGQWCFQLCGTIENLKFLLWSAFKLCCSLLRTPCSLTGGFPTFRRYLPSSVLQQNLVWKVTPWLSRNPRKVGNIFARNLCNHVHD